MKQNTIKKYEGPLFKRGEITTVQGRKFRYVKMVKGNLMFRSLSDNKLFKLTPADYLLPA